MTKDDETYLFVVRVWADKSGTLDGQHWHGKAQDVLSTRGGYFEDWQALINLLQSLLHDIQGDVYEARDTPITEGPSKGE